MTWFTPHDLYDAVRDGLAALRWRRAWHDPWAWRYVACAALTVAAGVDIYVALFRVAS